MVYATTDDLADYLHVNVSDLPQDVERMLERASEDVDYWTLDRIDTGHTEQAEAAMNATCAQVEMWLEAGEEGDIRGALQSFSLGQWSATFANADGPPKLANRSWRYLLRTGLLYRGVGMR